MMIYAPYVAVAFWGTMICFGLKSAFEAEKGPLIGPLRSIKQKLGGLIWAAIVLLFVVVVALVRQDSENIRRMASPVGLWTSLAFIPLVIADALLAAKLWLGDSNQAD